jgi:raffinose/stachyose/melibiose transport system substrate-binding protein
MSSTRLSRQLAATGLVAALGLAACAPSTGSEESTPAGGGAGEKGDVTLTFWSWRTDDVDAYEAIFDVYEESHPGVTVEHIPYKNTEYNQILATGLSGSQGPDIAMVKNYGQVQATIESGGIQPLDDQVDLSNFDETTLDALRSASDDQVYGVPFAFSTLHLYYNKAVFAEHGVKIPQTWDEFLEVAETLKAAGLVPLSIAGADSAVQVPAGTDVIASARYGGWTFENKLQAGETDLTDPDYVAALQLMKDIQPFLPENPSGVSYDDARILFTTGKAAMITTGSWDLAFFRAQNPDLEIGVFPVPTGPEWVSQDPLTPGFVDGGYALATKSDHPEEATELLDWMATPEYGKLFAEHVGQIPAVEGAKPTDPLLLEMADNYAEHGAPYLMAVDFRYDQPWGTDLLGVGIQELWLGSNDAAGVAADVWAGVSQWFKP